MAKSSTSLNFNSADLYGNNFSINDIIKQYPGLTGNTQGFGLTYDNSIITPKVIASAQAAYNPSRDAINVTQYQVKTNAAYQRQNNANKGVANLVSIVQKLTANVNAGKETIASLQSSLQKSVVDSRSCLLTVSELQDTDAKINNAVADKNNKKAQYEGQINEKEQYIQKNNGQLDGLRKNQQVIQMSIVPEGAILASVQDQLKRCQDKSQDPKPEIDDLSNQISKNNVEITVIQG